jgi:hypothetical protein
MTAEQPEPANPLTDRQLDDIKRLAADYANGHTHFTALCGPACTMAAGVAALVAEVRRLRAAPTVSPSAPADRAARRDRIRRAVCEAEGFAWDSDMLEPDEYGEVADTVLRVLLAELAQVVEHRDYWHQEAMFATARIVELERKLRHLAAEAPQPETQATTRQTVVYFLQTQQPDGAWEGSSSFGDDPAWVAERLATRREWMPQFGHRMAQRTTTVVVQPLEPPAPVASDADSRSAR